MDLTKSNPDDFRLDYWGRRLVDVLRVMFQLAREQARISVGFFTIQGYDLLKEVLDDVRVSIMVGFDEESKESVTQKLLDELLQSLQSWHVNCRAAVATVVKKLQSNELCVLDARA